MTMGRLSEWAFYPTLLYNLARNRFSSSNWPWFTRIDETVVLGALPFKSMVDQLVNEEHVGGVVCLNQPHEIEHEWVAKKQDWESVGVKFYWLPVPDFMHAPSHLDIGHAVNFIKEFENSRSSVYVHCKAGRTRSATIVAAYLMQKHGWLPNVAVDHIIQKRTQVLLRHAHWQSLHKYSKEIHADKT